MTTDDETLEMLVAEMAAHEAPITMVLRPTSAFQLASLLQLALRHPGTAGAVRGVALTFIEHVRQYFRDAPTIFEVLRRGDDPVFDVPSRITPEEIATLRADVVSGSGHECSEWSASGSCQLCDRPLAMRLRYRVLGSHVHCRLFTASSTLAFVPTGPGGRSAGQLTFSIAEWPLVSARLATVAELLEENA